MCTDFCNEIVIVKGEDPEAPGASVSKFFLPDGMDYSGAVFYVDLYGYRAACALDDDGRAIKIAIPKEESAKFPYGRAFAAVLCEWPDGTSRIIADRAMVMVTRRGRCDPPKPTPGGTSDYNSLENKPVINGVTVQGDLSLEDLGIVSGGTVNSISLNDGDRIEPDENGNIDLSVVTVSDEEDGVIEISPGLAVPVSGDIARIYTAISDLSKSVSGLVLKTQSIENDIENIR